MSAAFEFKKMNLHTQFSRRVIVVAALWFFVVLLWTAPAQLFIALLKPIAPQLQMQNVSGGFWHGTAAQAMWQQDTRAIALGSVEWKINPLSLLWLHPSVHVSTNYGDQFFDALIRVSPLGNIALRDVSGAGPISLLTYWLPMPANGTLAVKLDRVDIARQQLRAVQGTIFWQRAQWQWNSHWMALGDYSCVVQMPNVQQFSCALQGQGALRGNGDIAINFGERSYVLQAKLIADRSLPEEFRQMLSALLAVRPDANNQMPVKRSGHW